jgi:glycerol-3-phosphate dehydrogenase
MYDVTVIGCGVVGAAVAHELSRFRLSVAIVEKENDVACGTTKANSAIVHAGYDPAPGTLMARLNVAGSRMMEDLCRRLNVEYRRTGSLVLAFGEDDMKKVRELFRRGEQNGVEGLSILTREQTLALEPGLNPELTGALYAPSAAIVDPWGLAIALAQSAVRNGAALFLNSPVTKITDEDGFYRVEAGEHVLETKFIVNAAGTFADKINDMAAAPFFRIVPVKGEYYLLDKSQGNLVQHTIFQTPGEFGKGVLISPTVHGNLIVGPTSDPARGPEDVAVTAQGLEKIVKTALGSDVNVNFRESIRNFAGVRATAGERDDFIIGSAPGAPRFVNAAAIKSPGLTAAPAIAVEVRSILKKAGLFCVEKDSFADYRRETLFKKMTDDEKRTALARDPHYGRVICRCETITEGDILSVMRGPIPPVSIDGVKRRCNAGMGRCQGGFCGPRVHEILSRETGRSMEAIEQDRSGSYLLTGETKTGGVGV